MRGTNEVGRQQNRRQARGKEKGRTKHLDDFIDEFDDREEVIKERKQVDGPRDLHQGDTDGAMGAHSSSVGYVTYHQENAKRHCLHTPWSGSASQQRDNVVGVAGPEQRHLSKAAIRETSQCRDRSSSSAWLISTKGRNRRSRWKPCGAPGNVGETSRSYCNACGARWKKYGVMTNNIIH